MPWTKRLAARSKLGQAAAYLYSDSTPTDRSMSQSEEWTVSRLLQWTAEYLEKHGSDSPRLDAEVLLGDASGCPRIQLYARFNELVDDAVRAQFRETVKQRAAGAPVAYLVGAKEFYSLPFKVTRDVLIPRPETETLVLETVEIAKQSPSPMELLDIGVGSGIIAVCLAKYGNCQVTAVDISPPALQVAAANAATHHVDDKIRFIESDLFDALEPQAYDIITANPPYVSQAEYEQLQPSVKDFEPRVALVAGPQGDEIFQRIAEGCGDRLRAGGWLLVELSPMIAERCMVYAEDLGLFSKLEMVKDLDGNPRVLKAQRAEN